MPSKNGKRTVSIGTWVKLVERGEDEEEVFYLVPKSQEQALKNKISTETPLGHALEGACQGDQVTVEGPEGPVKLRVLEVGTFQV